MACGSVSCSSVGTPSLGLYRSSGNPSQRGRARMSISMPPLNPKDPFLSKLASAVAASPDPLPELLKNRNPELPPYLDLLDSPRLMASPAQVERVASYGEHRPRKPPPDLPSLLLHGRIVYIGMPLVPAVTELVIAELMYLQWVDSKQPIYLYINSTGTTRDDGETVGMEYEGFAIYDAMMQLKNEIQTVAVGAAIGQACLLLAAGKKGRRFMMPHSKAMIQQPRVPSSGQLPASDVLIRAKEVITNRDTLVKLLARHTGNSIETVSKVMRRPFYMDPPKAKEFGVIDKILWRGQEMMGKPPHLKNGIRKLALKLWTVFDLFNAAVLDSVVFLLSKSFRMVIQLA